MAASPVGAVGVGATSKISTRRGGDFVQQNLRLAEKNLRIKFGGFKRGYFPLN